MRNFLFSCCLNIINFDPFILWYLIKGKIDRFKCFITWSIWKIRLFLSLIWKSINNRFNEFVDLFGNSFLTDIFFLCLYCRICLDRGISRFLLKSSWLKSFITAAVWKIWFFFSFTWKWINDWFYKFMNFFGNSFFTNILFLCLYSRICLYSGICRFLLKSYWFINPFVLKFFLNPIIFYSILCNWKMNFFMSFFTWTIGKIWLFFLFTRKGVNYRFYEFMKLFRNSFFTYIFFLIFGIHYRLNNNFFIIYFIKL